MKGTARGGIDLDHFQRRLLQDAFAEAEAAYWERRARTFDAARPRPGDFIGQATPAELATQDARLSAVAEACRARAAVAGRGRWVS